MTYSYQLVLNTNVLLTGLRSNRGASYKLLTILNDTRWQLNVSTTLVFEYEEILKQEKEQLGLSDEDIDNVIEAICRIANRCSIFYLWRPVARDPDDDFLIDLAVEYQADFIITYNKKDLQAA
ncbi:putative toxin-antitoxin system toxin component, PIN family [Nostoc sp. ChiSLP03a]|uniref:putative toxin-antitoxin system toxin component, PIN family n=1 Tax=Nostoc sp. ChiSLP03a TaxID=3075380 RepID=UPI002AD3C216|nr:putative toxin-antitoxin system toxin component, PIN family [Nostoc sp. ChiSLP03a]MDZ8214123.1 putative toxin-antitoxin system toxin component, PIN family [Nostoc sp. ChiSLP03a]